MKHRFWFALALLSLLLPAALAFGQCMTPNVPSYTFAPPGEVGAGATYTLAWSNTTSDVDDYYVIERSKDSSFSTLLDSQEVSTTSASFLVDSEGNFHHRVKAVPACNSSLESGYSNTATVKVGNGFASVVFSVQPKPAITTLGQSLDGVVSTFVLENVTKRPVTVIVTTRTLGSSPNFFQVVDPGGGNLINRTLEPATPKTLEIHYDGFSTDVNARAAFQGAIVLISGEFAVTPYAFVNLKVGGTDSATPFFALGGVPVKYVFFPGFSGDDDSGRAAVTIDIINPGSSPQEIGAEIGPEIWLVPETGWNANQIPAGGTLSANLFTEREFALAGSPLPRYTYLTIHTPGGETARLLVQDNDTSSVDSARSKLGKEDRSFVIPGGTGADLGQQRRRYTIVGIANVGTSDITTEIFFTPAGADGLSSSSVKRAQVIIPANDVVRITDPLLQIFGVTGSADGQLEIRADSSRIGFLNVTARVFAPDTDGVGGVGYRLPVASRGEGARDTTPHTIPGVTVASNEAGEHVLTEATGADTATVRVAKFSTAGSQLGTQTLTIPRYSQARIANVLSSLGGLTQIVGGRLELTVTSGKGSIVGTLFVRQFSGAGWSSVSQPSSGPVSKRAALMFRQPVNWPDKMFVRRVRPNAAASPEASVQYVVPNVVNGPFGSISGTFQTTVGMSSPSSSSSTLTLTLVDSGGNQLGQKTVNLSPGQGEEYANVVVDLFGINDQTLGTLLIDSSNLGALVYARQSTSSGTTSPLLAVPTVSPSLTSAKAGETRPIYIDGLAQSVSSLRGSNWSLVMNEVRDEGSIVEVRLYEAGNRPVPIAAKTFTIPPLGEARMDSLFAGMNLNSVLRSKDRINVMVVVVPKSGDGLVSALVQSIDNVTGDFTTYQLTPSGGVPATGVNLAAPIPDEPVAETPVRRRPVRRD